VNQGVVTLLGRVPSFDDAEYASTLLGNLPGVIDVVDQTDLDPNGLE
jgi:osmotically-inducible protein OsmY